MPQTVLITGGAGYLGSILAPTLLAEGFHVRVLDNFYYGQNSLLDCCANPAFEITRGDCRDRKAMQKAMAGADYIIPMAALVGEPVCNEDEVAATSTNLDAVCLLLSLRSPEQRIVFPCTNSGYGIREKGTVSTEETPLQPISLYGRTKVEAERVILDAGNSISLRLATVFGVSPRMRLDLLVNDFVHRAVTDRTVVSFEGHFKRNYIPIPDVARPFLHARPKLGRNWGRP